MGSFVRSLSVFSGHASLAPAQLSVRRRLGLGAFWSLAGAAIARGLGLAGSICAARILGRRGFGELGMIQSTVGMFATFAGFGLGLMATKHIAEFRSQDRPKTGRLIGLSTVASLISGSIMAVILIACADWVCGSTLRTPYLAGPLRVSASLLLLNAVCGAQTGVLSGFEAFRTIAKINLISGLLGFPMCVIGAWCGIDGAVWGMSASVLVNCILNRVELRRLLKAAGITVDHRGCWREARVLWTFTAPALLGSILMAPATWLCNAMVARGAHGYENLALLNVGNQWRAAILFVPATLGGMILPVLANLSGENDSARYRTVLKYSLAGNAACALAVAVPVILFAGRILKAYGNGFAAGRGVLILTVAASGIFALNNQLSRAAASVGAMWASFWFDAVCAAGYLAGCAALFGRWGVNGIGAALLGAAALQFTAQAFYFRKKLQAERAA